MISYLSACSMAEVKTGTFADEAPHIVSAFQVVGFGHVISSIWSVDDAISVEVARLFYESLRGGNGQITNRAIAEALRGAVMRIRGHFPHVCGHLTFILVLNVNGVFVLFSLGQE